LRLCAFARQVINKKNKMTTIDTNISDLLERLGLIEINSGVTTGTSWFDAEGEITSSISPIDGKEIAKLKCNP